ncbi:unnamed protein product [Ophioblennius macclurei]
MAHGWNSYYHNLPPVSSDPAALRRTSDTEENLSNFIGQEFSNSVTSHEGHITNSNYCTNYFPDTGIENPDTDCIYQRYSSETPWQADEQTGKGYLQRCAKSDMPDFATDGFQTSELQDLGFKQECGIAASFLENYSDVSSCSDETKPSCNYVASNLLSKSKTDLPPENTSLDWISTHTGSMAFPAVTSPILETDVTMHSGNDVEWAQDKMDSSGNIVESSTGNAQSIATSYMTTTKFDTVHDQNDYDLKQDNKVQDFNQDISRNMEHGYESIIVEKVAACADDNVEAMILAVPATLPTDDKDLLDQKALQEESLSENQEFKHLNYTAHDSILSDEAKTESEVLMKEEHISGFSQNVISDSQLREENATFSEDSLPSKICDTDENLCQHECGEAGLTKDCLSPDSGDTCESVSEGIPASKDEVLSNCVESSLQLHNSNTTENLCPGDELAGKEQKIRETAKTVCSEPSFINDSLAENGTHMDVSQETKMTCSLEQNTTTSSAGQNCHDPSETNEQKVDCLQESYLQPVTPDPNEPRLSTEPEKACTTSMADPDDLSSSVTSDKNTLSAFRSLETCLELNTSCTERNSFSEREWTEQACDRNTNSLTDQQESPSKKTDAEETCLHEDVTENTQSSYKMDLSTEETSVYDTPYGEPLSREDSSCDPDETELDAIQDIDVDKCGDNGEFHSEQEEPQFKFSAQLKKSLHPVVVLTRLEATEGPSNVYHCADCSHTSANVDCLITHHHCSHTMADVQFCRTCNLYQIRNGQTKKHICGVISKKMISSDEGQQKTMKLGRHKCNTCDKRFSRIMAYIQHMRTHTGKTPFRCNGCGLYFSQPCSLTRHLRVPGRCKPSKPTDASSDPVSSEEQTPPQTNGVGDNKFANLPECYVKLVDVARTTLCYICGRNYPSVAKANKHRYAIHNMKSVAMLLKHFALKEKSNIDKKYKCPLCPRLFKYSYNRARHLRDCVKDTIYGGKGKVNGNYRCPLCSTTFSLPHNRYRHIKTFCLRECLNRLAKENPKPIKQKTDNEQKIQPQDDKQQTQTKKDEQKKHVLPKSPARSEPRYKCGLCPAVFHHPSGKYKHKKKHELYKISGKIIKYRKSIFSTTSKPTFSSNTKTEESTDNLKPTEESTDSLKSTEESTDSLKSTEDNHLDLDCHFCGKFFASSMLLKKHELRHRGEKPYLCLECGKQFKRRNHLIGHRTVHQKKIQCTICRKVLPTIGELIQHRSLHPKKGLLKCPECAQQFQYPAYLLRHLTVHQHKENKAPQLDEASSSKPQQSSELQEQTKSNPLQCSLCNKEFDDAQMLRTHCLTHISRSSSNQCPFCRKGFSSRQYLLRHMLQHTGNKAFSCTKCGKQFYRIVFLKLHTQKCLGTSDQLDTTNQPTTKKPTKTKNPYFCSICPRSFCKKIRLKNHLNAHRRSALQLCSNCGQYYGFNKINQHRTECGGTTKTNDNLPLAPVESPMKSTLQTDKDIDEAPPKSNTPKLLPLKCPHCPKRFRFKSVQLRHLVKHTGIQPYACMHCDQRFGSQTACINHEAFCNGICKDGLLKPKSDAVKKQPDMPPVEKTADHSQADSEAEYKCKFCTKTFIKPRSLRRHILTHNEVKPYRCKACDGCFSRYDHLKVHQGRCKGRKRRLEVCIPKISLDDVGKGWQIRFGNEPSEKKDTFECEVCTRNFSSQSKLSRHVTMFHTTKIFTCSRCGSAFSHEKSLKKHRKVNRCKRSSFQGSAVPPDGTDAAAENVTPQLAGMSRVLSRIQPIHNKNHKYGCTYCPRVFTNNSHLAVHIRLHTGEKPYSCEYCGQKFIRSDYLSRHFPKCTMKEQQSTVLCDRCGGLFPASKIENHKKSCTTVDSSATPASRTRQSTSDSPPRSFSCAYCSSQFSLFSQLQEHFLTSHKLETTEPPMSTAPLQQHLSDMPKNKEETADKNCGDAIVSKEQSATLESEAPKKFFCYDCNTSFINKAGLVGHKRTHRSHNPFTCKICKKSFGNKTLLRNHCRKCRKNYFATKRPEAPLKATLDFAVNDSFLIFKEKPETTGTGVLKTNLSHKDNLNTDESSQDSEESQEPSGSGTEKKEVQYQCSECDQTFTDGLMLISHLEDHGRQEQEKRRNTCTRCGRVCSNQANLEKHMKMHGITKKYSCPQCLKMFFTTTDLEDHKTCHDPKRPYFCKLCFQRFWTRPALCNHYREEHVDDAFTCQFCSKTYAAKKSLARHYKKWHQTEQNAWKSIVQAKRSDLQKPNSKISTSGESDKEENIGGGDSDSDLAPYFPCHVCGKTFTTSENLEDHQLCHLGEKPHECAECGKCFFQASQLQQHQRMHQSEFQCPTCGKGFVSLFALRKHKHSHVKIHPYRCSKCNLTFKCQSQLTEHMSTHQEDNFPCDICNQVFVSKSSRAEHRKCHTISHNRPQPGVLRTEQEQPTKFSETSAGCSTELKYRCGVCHERFIDPENLSEHGCRVTKERPYSCSECDKHFLHSSHLKKHRYTHLPSGSNSEYPCNQCNTTFYSTKDFLSHLNSHDDIVVEIKRESDDEGEGPIPTFICPVCHQCFPSGIELIDHFPTHPNGAYKCEKRILTEKKKEDHKGSIQTSLAAVKCVHCGQSFSGGDALHQHSCSRKRQKAVKKSFSKPSSRSHYRRDEEDEVDVTREESYNCPACSKQFTSKSGLLEHQNIEHSEGKPFKCEICGKFFGKKRYLTRHKHIHSQNATVSETLKPQKREFICGQCDTSFSTKQTLSEHMRLHAVKEVGEYRCDMCYKSFSQWSLLRQHQESHVGEVVYECTECDKAFAFPHLLEEHQQTHAESSR